MQLGLEKENINTADDIYSVFKALEYISTRYTSGLNPISLKMCISYFMICSRCKIESKQQCYPAVLDIDNLDENAIENSVGKISPKWQSICCKIGKKQFGSYVESLPEAFFLYLKNTEGLTPSCLKRTFQLDRIAKKAYPFALDEYKVQHIMIICENTNEPVLISKCNDTEQYQVSNCEEWVNISDKDLEKLLQNCGGIFIVLERFKYCLEGNLNYFANEDKDNLHCVQLNNFSDDIETDGIFISGRYSIYGSTLINMLNFKNWMSDNMLNLYFEVLKLDVKSNVDYAPAGWLNQVFFDELTDNEKPYVCQKFMKNTEKLFSKRIIYFPININNNHWILVVANLHSKNITVCDSLGSRNWKFVLSAFHYLCQSSVIENKSILKPSLWTVSYFHEKEGFPVQRDNYSCGSYVCLMAKCLQYNLKFRFEKRMARETIVHEIIEQKIIL